MAQKLQEVYEPKFSEGSYGYRPNRSAQDAIERILSYANEGYDWVIDMDLEKFFDTDLAQLISSADRIEKERSLSVIELADNVGFYSMNTKEILVRCILFMFVAFYSLISPHSFRFSGVGSGQLMKLCSISSSTV